jgi:hypothetical protein
MTLAINEMLLQSHEGALRFFPVWPAHRGAAFTTLRTNGGFLVSAEHPAVPSAGAGGAAAAAAAAIIITAQITSTVGGNCSVFGSLHGAPPIVTHKGVAVAVEALALSVLGELAWRFVTAAGQQYSLRMQGASNPF